jgi:hypothetical protein
MPGGKHFTTTQMRVALDVKGLEGRMRPRRSRVVVPGDRGGHIATAPSRDAGAQAKVGVLAVGKEVLVEEDRFQSSMERR